MYQQYRLPERTVSTQTNKGENVQCISNIGCQTTSSDKQAGMLGKCIWYNKTLKCSFKNIYDLSVQL